jgi:hypothetical protein
VSFPSALCLSRACLGKMIAFISKSGQRTPFSYRHALSSSYIQGQFGPRESFSMPGQGIAPPVTCGIGSVQFGGGPCLSQEPGGPMHLRENVLFFEVCLCLSRACLGKSSKFSV